MRSISSRSLTLFAFLLFGGHALGQTQNYFGIGGALSGSVWSTNPAGPYTSALNTAGGAVINFGNAANFTGGDITVAGINATASASLTSSSGIISNQGNGVITINVATGATLDFGSQSFTSSGTAGYIKTGDGVLALMGGTYGGGFTLNAGTVILRHVNALGSGATNTLKLNGGIVASDANHDLTGKYGGGITIGGNVQFGDGTGPASGSANLTFSNNVNLGNSNRIFTLGHAGATTFNGVVSGTANLRIEATANGAGGKIVLGGANTYTGGTTVAGGVLQFNTAASIGGTGSVAVNSGGTMATGYALDQTTIGRVNIGSGGVLALAANSGNNLNLTGYGSNLNLGAVGGTVAVPVVYSGTLTPHANIYRLGGGGGVLQVSSALTGARDLTISRNGTVAGTIILSAANTYTGPTRLQAGTLLVNSSIGTGLVTVSNTTTFGGTGTVGGTVEVRIGGIIRGGFAGGSAAQATGTLNLANTTLNDAAGAGTTGATLAVDLNGNANPTTAAGSNSLLAFGANTFTLDSTPGKFNIRLLNDGALTDGQSYTINLASGTFVNGNGGGSTFTDADFNLQSGSGAWAFNNVSLAVSGSNLRLTFTVAPVPEPATVLAIGAAGLGLVTWVRRRRKPATV